MKILFVCKSNFGRSQMAEGMFNRFSRKHTAISAGTKESRVTGHVLKEFPEHSNLFTCMDEIGVDVREKISKQLTPRMVKEADKVIVMAEKETWPPYLKTSPKIIFWNVEDACGKSVEKHREIRDRIKKSVQELVREID